MQQTVNVTFRQSFKTYRLQHITLEMGVFNFLNLVNNYAAKYDTLTDAEATAGLKEKMAIESERADLKQKYTKKIAKILSPKKALRFAQLETRIELAVRSQVYSLIPLAH